MWFFCWVDLDSTFKDGSSVLLEGAWMYYERHSIFLPLFWQHPLCKQTPVFKGLLLLGCACFINTSLQDWGCAGTSAVSKLLRSLTYYNTSWILWLWNNFAVELGPWSICGGVRSSFIYVAWNNDKPVSDMGYTCLFFHWDKTKWLLHLVLPWREESLACAKYSGTRWLWQCHIAWKYSKFWMFNTAKQVFCMGLLKPGSGWDNS